MIHVIKPGKVSKQLEKMAQGALENVEYVLIKHRRDLPDLKNRKILFVIELDSVGTNIPLMKIMAQLYQVGKDALKDSTAALLIHSNNELYTKDFAANIIFLANQLGCSFIGHPMVEAINELKNFRTRQKREKASLEE